MRIVVLDGYTLNPGDLSWDSLAELGELTVFDRTPKDKIIERIGDAEVIFTNKTPLTKETLEKTKSVKYIGVLATGYNVVDCAAARALGISVTNIPTYGTDAVAQMTFALLLEVCHHVWSHSEKVKMGEWTNSKDFCFWDYPLIELTGKTFGIIGYGRIGQSVARIAQGFGMKVIAYSRSIKGSSNNEYAEYAELDKLLKEADVVSLHCPLTESTRGLINKNTIAEMKESVIIINTSRGQLINEEDLADALNGGKVFGAAVDVVSTEPIMADNPLLKAKNCIITPHIAWAPKESRARLMDIAVNNLRAFIDNKSVNVVN